MNGSVLTKLREEYDKIKKGKETLLSYKKELEELSQDEKVKQFLELSEKVDMVYMGSYIKDSTKGDNDREITYERNPDTSYKVYMDLETTEEYQIDKDKCLDFENEYYKKYCELQKWFRMKLIHRLESDVISELQEKYERKYNRFYPSFHRSDTVAIYQFKNI